MSHYIDDIDQPVSTEHAVSDPVTVLQHMANVREAIRSCTRCELAEYRTQAVPFRGPAPAPLTIVGEAPGPREDEQGKPFIGPSGKLLDKLMAECLGFDSRRALVCNSISCIPRDEPGGRFRAPTNAEKRACYGHFMAQLALADSPVILALGAHALRNFRDDRPIGMLHGRPMYWGGKTVFSTFHPAAALRQKSYERAIVVDLVALRRLLDDPGARWPEDCVGCQSFEVEHCDERRMFWCAKCAPDTVRGE